MGKEKIDISGSVLLKTLALLAIIWITLFYGASLLLPLLVAALIATLMDKPTKQLKKWGLPDGLAITLSIVLLCIVLFLLAWLISSQLGNMADDWPTIKEKATEKYGVISNWAKRTLQIDPTHFVDNKIDFVDKLKNFSKAFIASLTNLLSQSFIIFIYIILFLMQKKMFMGFFRKLVKNEEAAAIILVGSSQMVSDYLFGKGKIMFFLFVIYYAGFSIGQVPFALFLSLFAALFSIIPYVGNLIGGGVAVILAYLYSGGTPALIVIGVITVAQLAENYILTPWIIGDEIDLNPFVTVFGVILFSVLWGMVGAIIALPMLGVLKVILAHTKGTEAYVYLLTRHDD